MNERNKKTIKPLIVGVIAVLFITIFSITFVSADVETLYAEDLTSANTINNEANAYGAASGSVATVLDLDNGQYVDAVIGNHASGDALVGSATFQIKLKKAGSWNNDVLDISYSEDGGVTWHEVGTDYAPQDTLTWTTNYTATEVDTWAEVDAMQIRITGDQVASPDSGDIDIDAYNIYAEYSAAATTLEIGNNNNIENDWGQSGNSNISITVSGATAENVNVSYNDTRFTNVTDWGDKTVGLYWDNQTVAHGSTIGNVYVAVKATTTSSGGTNDTEHFWVNTTKRANTATMDSDATQSVVVDENFFINATCNEEYGDPFYGNADLLEDGTIVATEGAITDYVNFARSESSEGVYNYSVRFYNTTHYANATTPTYTNVTVSGAEVNYTPPNPTNLQHTKGNFFVNFTWDAGSGNITNSWNVSFNESWDNETLNNYTNKSVGAHCWGNTTVFAWNSSGSGTLSEGYVSDNVQLANNIITITNTSDWSGSEGQLVYLDFDYTDADGDAGVFATNATEGSLNTATGVFEWQTDTASQGTYFWNFTVNDGWGSEDYYVANITVTDSPDAGYPIITDWYNNLTNDNSTFVYINSSVCIYFNATANQTIDTWHWYKNENFLSDENYDNITVCWNSTEETGILKVWGSNANGITNTVVWYVGENMSMINESISLLLEENEMIAQTWLFLVLLLISFVFLAAGYLSPNATLKIFGAAFSSVLFIILAYAIIGNQFGEKLQMAWLATLLGALGIIQAIYTLLLVISLLYMMFTTRRQAGVDSIPFDPGDRNW